MEDRQIVIGGFYRHFKDKLYQVRCIAYHSETKEKIGCVSGVVRRLCGICKTL